LAIFNRLYLSIFHFYNFFSEILRRRIVKAHRDFKRFTLEEAVNR